MYTYVHVRLDRGDEFTTNLEAVPRERTGVLFGAGTVETRYYCCPTGDSTMLRTDFERRYRLLFRNMLVGAVKKNRRQVEWHAARAPLAVNTF